MWLISHHRILKNDNISLKFPTLLLKFKNYVMNHLRVERERENLLMKENTFISQENIKPSKVQATTLVGSKQVASSKKISACS